MFIELAEFLRCPEPHESAYCVLAPEVMVGRDVARGTIGCPVCRREYAIVNGIVEFGGDGWSELGGHGSVVLPHPEVVQALLGLASPGGYLALVGSAARLAPALAELIGGVHFVATNPPPDLGASPLLSPLRSARVIPLGTAVVRGVVLGSEHARQPWLAEGARILLRGQRLVVLSEDAAVPELGELVTGQGIWVGQKR